MQINRRDFNYGLALSLGSLPLLRFPFQQQQFRINSERIMAHIRGLAEFGTNPQGGVSRVAYSDADKQGREYVLGLMKDARLDVTIDAAGNLIGRRPGSVSKLPPLLIGSHIDTVPEGGNYDGVVGSMGAIEVAQTLAEKNVALRHPFEVVIFQNEEGGLIGSRAMNGELTEKELDLVSRSGKTIREGIKFIGGDPSKLSEVKRTQIGTYIELHIEQGGTLDSEKINIGVVEGIVGINWWDVTIEGFANHAGTTAMNNRQDALLAAARFIQAVNQIVTSVPGRQVGTVGRINALPGAPNVIPDFAQAEVFVRLIDHGEAARALMTEAAGDLAELKEVIWVPAVHMKKLDGFETCVVAYTTDIPAFEGAWGEPLLLGPGSINVAHTDEERILKHEIIDAIEIYKQLARKLLQT